MTAIPSDGHLFFVTDLNDPVLHDADQHHAARVLRLRDGEVCSVGDGVGGWRRVRWQSGGLVVDGDVHRVDPPAEAVTVAFALVKGAKPELIVQKLTELGVDTVIPFVAERSVVRWDEDKAQRQSERWQVTARAAAMQSRRAMLPTVEPVATFDQVAQRPGALLADRDGRVLEATDRFLVIGPEGGWSERERSVDTPRVAMGTGVLRAETAAIAAATLLTWNRAREINRGG